MATVNTLKRKTKDGYSLYLDYRVNGKRVQERTGLILLDGKSTTTKQHNKEVMIRFKYMLVEKQKQLMDGIAVIPLPVRRQKVDFIQFFRKFMEVNPSKERRDTATLRKLIAFHGNDTLPITEVTEDYLRMFKNYLENKLSGETPYDYFKYLKMVIKQATKEGWFAINPAEDIKVSRKSNEPKSSLTIEELKILVNTECPNEVVKRAFLFSCFTGLRYCDVKVLRWSNISEDNILKIVQAKTNHPVSLPLVDDAVSFAGKRGNKSDLIFPLPTGNGTNKSLKIWVKNAGIEKHITYHCSRHAFATNLTISGVDLLLTSAAMGHKSIKETPRYIRLDEQQVSYAVLKLQSIG